jgi:hypothetical protein
MPNPEDYNPENYRIVWPAILAVFVVQMVLLIAVSIAVVNHSSIATAPSLDVTSETSLTGSDIGGR